MYGKLSKVRLCLLCLVLTLICVVCVCVESLDDKIQWSVVQSCRHLHALVVELSHASVWDEWLNQLAIATLFLAIFICKYFIHSFRRWLWLEIRYFYYAFHLFFVCLCFIENTLTYLLLTSVYILLFSSFYNMRWPRDALEHFACTFIMHHTMHSGTGYTRHMSAGSLSEQALSVVYFMLTLRVWVFKIVAKFFKWIKINDSGGRVWCYVFFTVFLFLVFCAVWLTLSCSWHTLADFGKGVNKFATHARACVCVCTRCWLCTDCVAIASCTGSNEHCCWCSFCFYSIQY